MKKNILFVLAVAMISFASCKKDRTCTCDTVTNPGGSTTHTVDTESHLTKKEGMRVLNCYSYTTTNTYGGVAVTTTATCTLK